MSDPLKPQTGENIFGRSLPRSASSRDGLIPKEQMTAFERWELASFDNHPGNRYLGKDKPGADADAQRRQLLLQNIETDYARKIEEGYARGMQQAQADIGNIHSLMQNLQTGLNQVDQQVAQSLLELSLEVARQMVRESLQLKPEIILKVVSDAIASLPHLNQNAHLILHPDDAELVRTQMGEQLAHTNWRIFTDPNLHRGGCRIETAHSNIDAAVETRWRHIVDAIGQDTSWLK
ncbi:MAG: flagellar assembly protein FliH [Gallionella sp.]